MPRQKTRLTPDEQWTRTVRYATLFRGEEAEALWPRWQEGHAWECRFQRRAIASEEEQRELWRAARRRCQIVPPHGRSAACVAVVTRAHRWLDVGDVLHLVSSNGMNERFGVSGVSSKGVRLRCCYLRLDHGTGQGVIETIGLPDPLIGLRWDSEAVRAFAHECREGVLARRGS